VSKTKSFHEQIQKLASSAHREFCDVSDYIWKSPKLVSHEKKLELEKLQLYFPDRADLRELRWKHEEHKLHNVFPFLIATGNLFSTISLFETYALLLAGHIRDHTGTTIESAKGSGIGRLLNYFKSFLPIEQLPLSEQVRVALSIRNCMTHASGLLTWSRDEKEIRRIITTHSYLSQEIRQRKIDLHRNFDEVVIEPTSFGDRLQISNSYSHLVASDLRTYFVEVCDLAIQKWP
jgi:hypothetical protein